MSEEETPKPKEMQPLDEDEKKTMEKRLETNKKEVKGLLFAKHQAELMLAEGIDADYIMKESKYKKQLSAVDTQLTEINFAIEVSEKQLKDGVEVREAIPLPKEIIVELPPEKNYFDMVDSIEDLGMIVKNKEVKENEIVETKE